MLFFGVFCFGFCFCGFVLTKIFINTLDLFAICWEGESAKIADLLEGEYGKIC